MDLSHKAPFPRSSCHSINEATKLIKRLKQRCATSREGARTPHGPALPPVIYLSAARGARPAQDPRATMQAHHSHTTIAPCPRPQSRHRGRPPPAAARGRVLQGRAPPPRPEPSAEGEGIHHTAVQSTGAPPARHKTESRAAHNNRKKPAFANKCDVHRACRCEAAGTAVRDERLADFVLQNNSTAEQGVRGGGCSQGQTAQCGTSGELGTSR